MSEFYRTRMGVTFYEHTMPSLVRAIERLAERREADDHADRLRAYLAAEFEHRKMPVRACAFDGVTETWIVALTDGRAFHMTIGSDDEECMFRCGADVVAFPLADKGWA